MSDDAMQELKAKLRELYSNQANKFEFLMRKEGEQLDKFIFAVATGSVALSASYVIGVKSALVCTAWLAASWAAFLLCISSIILGFYFSKGYDQNMVKELRNAAITYDPFFRPTDVTESLRGKAESFTTASMVLVLVGLLLLAVFAYSNIPVPQNPLNI